MKLNNGMTIISLIIYILVLSVVIGTTSIFIKYFYNNVDDTVISKKNSSNYLRFVEYITDDVNSRENNFN